MTREMHRWRKQGLPGLRNRGKSILSSQNAPDFGNDADAEAYRQHGRATRQMLFGAMAVGAFIAVAVYYVVVNPGPNSTLHRHLKASGYKPLF